jgi:hypothetical protein
MLRHFEDAWVTRVPSEDEIRRAAEAVPGTHVDILVSPGTRLSELQNQDSYSYELADIYIGASERSKLEESYRRVLEILTFEFEPGDGAYFA